jgi:excisionase family DNA binding protein
VLLTPEEAAGRMGISRAHVYRLIGARELDSIKIGRSRRVPVAALDDFIERSKI